MGPTVSADLINDDCICIYLRDALREIPKREAWREIASLISPEFRRRLTGTALRI